MPTILLINGWRVFFYSNEGHESPHVHAVKGDAECKLWIDIDAYDIQEARSHGMSPRLRREIRKIVFDHFDYIVERWNDWQEQRGEN